MTPNRSSLSSHSQSPVRRTILASNARRGTRIPCHISMTLTSLDVTNPFSEPALVILANPQGCAVRFGRPLKIGAAVELNGLPLSVERSVTAQVVNCISLGQYEKFWLIGLALDEPGNVWGIETPPADWASM
jgi:hypothetical protein